MTRGEIVALIVSEANAAGIDPYELLGGAVAESALDVTSERDGVPPDVSFGLFQQTAKFAPEGDLSADLPRMRALYFDPSHACDVAIKEYLYWRHDPDVSPLQAWCAYNLPASYRLWPNIPNTSQRENYRAGLAQAQAILGGSPVPDPPTYSPDTPVVQQQHDWDCAEQSTLWGVTALGRHPSDAWMESQMQADGVESTALGLLDGTGAALAAWITREYSDPSEGTPTLKAVNAATVSFDDVKSVAGTTSVLLGGHRWGAAGHWSGVRGYDAVSDLLLLANPANGYAGVFQTMNRQQFTQVAPCAMVVIRADGAVPAPIPPPAPPTPNDTIRAQLAAIRAACTEIEAALA